MNKFFTILYAVVIFALVAATVIIAILHASNGVK
jgi:hypothetical protein